MGNKNQIDRKNIRFMIYFYTKKLREALTFSRSLNPMTQNLFTIFPFLPLSIPYPVYNGFFLYISAQHERQGNLHKKQDCHHNSDFPDWKMIHIYTEKSFFPTIQVCAVSSRQSYQQGNYNRTCRKENPF